MLAPSFADTTSFACAHCQALLNSSLLFAVATLMMGALRCLSIVYDVIILHTCCHVIHVQVKTKVRGKAREYVLSKACSQMGLSVKNQQYERRHVQDPHPAQTTAPRPCCAVGLQVLVALS
jgi:hypothetical protein